VEDDETVPGDAGSEVVEDEPDPERGFLP